MKIVISGCTGFIGGEVLRQTLKNPAITSVVVLSRKPLSIAASSDVKVQVVLVDDFLHFSDAVMKAIEGAQGCVWALGSAMFPDNETARKVTVDYTTYAARTISKVADRRLRFVFLSGVLGEKDQSKPLWFMETPRRIKGQAETELLQLAVAETDRLDAYVFRPGAVLTATTTMKSLVLGLMPSVRVDKLASSMINMAINGGKDKVLENSMI